MGSFGVGGSGTQSLDAGGPLTQGCRNGGVVVATVSEYPVRPHTGVGADAAGMRGPAVASTDIVPPNRQRPRHRHGVSWPSSDPCEVRGAVSGGLACRLSPSRASWVEAARSPSRCVGFEAEWSSAEDRGEAWRPPSSAVVAAWCGQPGPRRLGANPGSSATSRTTAADRRRATDPAGPTMGLPVPGVQDVVGDAPGVHEFSGMGPECATASLDLGPDGPALGRLHGASL